MVVQPSCGPPPPPHFGGVNEIMVKAAKKAIYAVIGNAEVNDEELITVFSGALLAPEAVETTGFHPKQRWRKVQRLISLVWRRWMKEYLPTLIPRSKWLKVQGDLQVGDIVLVCQSDLPTEVPRGHWPLQSRAKIIETSSLMVHSIL